MFLKRIKYPMYNKEEIRGKEREEEIRGRWNKGKITCGICVSIMCFIAGNMFQ